LRLEAARPKIMSHLFQLESQSSGWQPRVGFA